MDKTLVTIVVCSVLALLLSAGIAAVVRKASPLRLVALFSLLLIAVLAFFTGNPEVVKEVIATIVELFR